MTKLLEQAIERMRTLPPDMQDDFASALIRRIEEEAEPVPLTAEEKAAIATSKAAAERGAYASKHALDGVWAKYGL